MQNNQNQRGKAPDIDGLHLQKSLHQETGTTLVQQTGQLPVDAEVQNTLLQHKDVATVSYNTLKTICKEISGSIEL